MSLLLDTCTFLWAVSDPASLSDAAAAALSAPDTDVYLSAVSAWEIAVKHRLGKLRLDRPPERYVVEERTRHGILPLALDEDATLRVHRLPDVHRDPVDRMLVCQALAEGLTVVTPDLHIACYPIRVLW